MSGGVLNFSNGFKGCRIDEKLKVIAKGVLLVTSHEIQFMPNKRVQNNSVWAFSDIKKYGCHSNVLSIGLGKKYNDEVLHFTFKEAVVVRELMDQVIKNKHKPMPRMPSVDKGFYEMNPVAPKVLQRANSLQENSCYNSIAANANYSQYNAGGTSVSSDSGSSLGGSSSYENTGHDNPAYSSTNAIQYSEVEIDSSLEDPFSPGPASPQKKRFFSSLKKKLSVIEYSKIDQLTTNHLREMDEEEQKGM